MTIEELKNELLKYNINLTDNQQNQFARYFELLCKYNEVMDLTAVKNEEIIERHFFNSLTIAFNRNFDNLSLLDIGSGAGFPAIPLKIAFPNMKLTIVDSLSKRMDFLKMVIKELKLDNVEIIVSRVEDIARDYKEKFDIVTARAVAPLNILIELSCQLVKINGMFIAMKGSKAIEELNKANKAIKICKLELIKKEEYLPSINLFFKKIDSIDNKYPRNYSKIKSKPL